MSEIFRRLSHADRAYFALAIKRGADVYSVDRQWSALSFPFPAPSIIG